MLEKHLSALRSCDALTLPLPGQGATALRHQALLRFGQKDLSLARIAEAHTDALAILAEARCAARPDALYGVWASDGPASRVSARPKSGWPMLRPAEKGMWSPNTSALGAVDPFWPPV